MYNAAKCLRTPAMMIVENGRYYTVQVSLYNVASHSEEDGLRGEL